MENFIYNILGKFECDKTATGEFSGKDLLSTDISDSERSEENAIKYLRDYCSSKCFTSGVFALETKQDEKVVLVFSWNAATKAFKEIENGDWC